MRTRDPLSGQLQAELDLRHAQTLSNLQLDVPELVRMCIVYTVPFFLYLDGRETSIEFRLPHTGRVFDSSVL